MMDWFVHSVKAAETIILIKKSCQAFFAVFRIEWSSPLPYGSTGVLVVYVVKEVYIRVAAIRDAGKQLLD
jgi:hypothetical protein